jgi:hypothetical protein
MPWIALVLAGLVHAQDLPDPGRRVFDDDRRAEQLKRSEAEEKRSGLGSPPERKPDARACEGSRVEVQITAARRNRRSRAACAAPRPKRFTGRTASRRSRGWRAAGRTAGS